MSPPRSVQKTYTEGDIQLTISNLSLKQFLSVRRATATYNVPRTTIRRRRARQRSRRDCKPNSKRLTKLEEEVIVERILEQSLQGVPPLKAIVRDIANRLLRERSREAVSKN
jgi:hypothetical protein